MRWEDILIYHLNAPYDGLPREKKVQESYQKYLDAIGDPNEVSDHIYQKMFSDKSIFRFTKCSYPYYFADGTEHFLLWFNPFLKYPLHLDLSLVHYLITCNFYPSKVVFFMNDRKNRSVKDVPHYHIFVKNVDIIRPVFPIYSF